MSVEISEPLHRTAVAMNIQQLAVATRFEGATRRGDVGPDAMTRISAALRAVQDL
jgi:mRNA interferase MazF